MEQTTLWVKGSGSTGCLLAPNCHDQKDFIPFNPGFKVKEIALSGIFILVIDEHENLYIWGTIRNKIVDRPCLLKEGVTRISCGWYHALLESLQTVYGIGSNSNLQLGIEATQYVSEPTAVWKGKVDHFICGFRQSYIIAEDSLFGCGQTKKYELSCSSKKPLLWKEIYSNISSLLQSPILKLSVGKRFLLIQTAKGEIWGLGANEQNVFNQTNVSHFIIPNMVYQDVRDVSCGWAHVVLLEIGGKVKSLGRDNLGQLGREEGKQMELPLGEGEQVVKIVSGSQYSFALTSRFRVFGWGWNEHNNISNCGSRILDTPQNMGIPGRCSRLWTYPAITIIQDFQK